jgi:hypothetical protein
VMNDPKSVAEGRDLQIERAVAELMKENQEKTPSVGSSSRSSDHAR